MLHVAVHIHGLDPPGPLSVTFDSVAEQLAKLPRMFFEPDGSFVGTGISSAGESWQVDGNLIDRGDVLAYVELKGSCPQAEFNSVLNILGWPRAMLAFQLPQSGKLLDEREFFRRAESPDGAI